MPKKVVVKDETLLLKVTQQLAKRGIRTPCKVKVLVMKGNVTLSGEVQYEVQKKTAMHAAREVYGVQRVFNQLTVKPLTSAWKSWKQNTKGPGRQ